MDIKKIIQEEIELFLERRPRIGKIDMGRKVSYDDSSFNTYVTSAQLDSLEKELDSLFSNAGIDIEFTKHFLDRINDPRNKKSITIEELRHIFKDVYSKYKDAINDAHIDFEAVIKSISTDINIPFALEWDKENQELDLVSKTIMRKKDFKTTNPVLKVKQ